MFGHTSLEICASLLTQEDSFSTEFLWGFVCMHGAYSFKMGKKERSTKKWRSHRCSRNRLYFFRHRRLTRFVVTLKCKFRIREQQHAVDAVLGLLDGRCMYVLHKEMLSFLPTRPGILFSQNRMHAMEFFFLLLFF